jgi:hypothetical protein
VTDGGMSITPSSRPSNDASLDMGLPPSSRRTHGRSGRATLTAGTLSTVSDHTAGEDVQRDIEVRNADGYDPDDVKHDAKCGWTEAERQAFLRRAQYVDPRERRAWARLRARTNKAGGALPERPAMRDALMRLKEGRTGLARESDAPCEVSTLPPHRPPKVHKGQLSLSERAV